MPDDQGETLLNRKPPTAKPAPSASGDSLPMDIESPDYTERLYAGLVQRYCREEGGIANRPRSADKGGPTNKGLSKALVEALKKRPGEEGLAAERQSRLDSPRRAAAHSRLTGGALSYLGVFGG